MKFDQLPRIRHTRTLIFLFGMLMLSLMWISIYFFAQQERKIEIADAYKDTTTYARTFAEHTVRTIKGLDQIALFLKYQAENEGLKLDIPRFVRESRFAGQPFVLLSIADENGELISSSQLAFVPANIKDREHFIVHKNYDSGPFISKPVLGRASGKWSIQLSRRINKPDGSFGGVVVVSVDPFYFAHFYQLIDLGENASIALIGRDGITRARQAGSGFSLGQDFGPRLEELLAAGNAGNYAAASQYDGIRRFYSFLALDDFPLIVIVGVSESHVFHALNERISIYYRIRDGISVIILLFMLALMHDISRRKQIEDQLRRSEENFRYLTENSSDVIWHVDATLRFDYVSPADERMRGFTAAEVLGSTLWDQARPEKADYLRQQHSARLEAMTKGLNQSPVRLELEIRCKNGGLIWGEVIVTAHLAPDGRFIGLHGVTRDISDRKRAEKVLMENQVRYHALVEQSFEALSLIDIQTQEAVEINRRFTEILGYSLPEDTPLYVQKYVVESKANLDYLFNNLLGWQRVLPVKTRTLRHKNGTEVAVEIAATVVSIGGRDYLLASLRDLTDERRRQTEAARDVELARVVQQSLLPELPESPLVTLRTLYYPSHFVSGDSYYLEWRNEGKLLCGYLIDVSGHGVSTALQTASLMALLREASASPAPLLDQMQRTSKLATKYFTEGAYAAMIGFELDLTAKELHYVAAGITQFYVNGEKHLAPSMFIGILPDEEFSSGTLPLSEGDVLFFLTDGFTDLLTVREGVDWSLPIGKNYESGLAHLEELASLGQLRDDATALCIRINRWQQDSKNERGE